MNNNILIAYKSATGFTREYAEAAAASLGCPCAELSGVSPRQVPAGGILVFGARLHAGKLDGLKRALSLYRSSQARRLVVFATGASPAGFEDVEREMWENNLGPELLGSVPHFYLPAGLRYESMGLGDRMMMRALQSFMRRKKDKTEYELQLQRMISASYDISSPEYLEPMLALLRAGV